MKTFTIEQDDDEGRSSYSPETIEAYAERMLTRASGDQAMENVAGALGRLVHLLLQKGVITEAREVEFLIRGRCYYSEPVLHVTGD